MMVEQEEHKAMVKDSEIIRLSQELHQASSESRQLSEQLSATEARVT